MFPRKGLKVLRLLLLGVAEDLGVRDAASPKAQGKMY